MTRIDSIFENLQRQGRQALMPFITAGDPDLDTTGRILEVLQRCGADVCEIGFPFSDPIADGPVIQASMSHALGQDTTAEAVLELISRLRPRLTMGLVAMVSFSIVKRLGIASFVQRAREAGIDGLILPDLPLEEYTRDGISQTVAQAGLSCSLLIAPTTPTDRAQQIAKACTGFVYLLSRSGLTGERSSLPQGLDTRVQQLRAVTSLPIAVGFGISTGQQVQQVFQVADAAIVGSAIMRRVAQYRDQGGDAVVNQVEVFANELVSPTKADS